MDPTLTQILQALVELSATVQRLTQENEALRASAEAPAKAPRRKSNGADGRARPVEG